MTDENELGPDVFKKAEKPKAEKPVKAKVPAKSKSKVDEKYPVADYTFNAKTVKDWLGHVNLRRDKVFKSVVIVNGAIPIRNEEIPEKYINGFMRFVARSVRPGGILYAPEAYKEAPALKDFTEEEIKDGYTSFRK